MFELMNSPSHYYLQNFNASDLNAVIPMWKGLAYAQAIPDDICREILEEICRVSFKFELLLLDRYLYDVKPRDWVPEDGEVFSELDASSREDRNIKVVGAVMLDAECLGFAAIDLDRRREAYLGLYNVMKGWNHYRTSPMSDSTHAQAEKLKGRVTSEEFPPIEYYLAYYYISTFAKFFKRPPTLPYSL